MRIGSSLFDVDLTAQHNLLRAYSLLNRASTRLSTMHRINSGADDPAGLVAVEKLQAELDIERADSNAARGRHHSHGRGGLLSDLASGGAANLKDGDHAKAMAILDAAQG